MHYELLRQLARQPAATQRHLAVQLNVSVGKVNYCLRALMEKGWVKMNNFRRSDNKLAYSYLLTPSGVVAKIALTRQFLAVKELEFETLQEQIDHLRVELDLPTRQNLSQATRAGEPAATQHHKHHP